MEVVRLHRMRRMKAVLLVLGIVAIALAVYHIGPAPILEALARLTWWQLVLVCLPYAAIMAGGTPGVGFPLPPAPAPLSRLFGGGVGGRAPHPGARVGWVGGAA